jgi:RNA polymerase sigma factor (sigma-70 family)
MSSQPITRMIRSLQEGRTSAIHSLFEVYFQRLVQLARARLQGMPGLAAYDEDVALRSFESMCRRLGDTTRPLELASRDDFWRLLATRTVSRAIDLLRRQRPNESLGEHDLEQLLSREPAPEDAVELADECRRLLEQLDEPELRLIALLKVEGYTNDEIARMIDCVPRTVERKLNRIRLLWQAELEELDA